MDYEEIDDEVPTFDTREGRDYIKSIETDARTKEAERTETEELETAIIEEGF